MLPSAASSPRIQLDCGAWPCRRRPYLRSPGTASRRYLPLEDAADSPPRDLRGGLLFVVQGHSRRPSYSATTRAQGSSPLVAGLMAQLCLVSSPLAIPSWKEVFPPPRSQSSRHPAETSSVARWSHERGNKETTHAVRAAVSTRPSCFSAPRGTLRDASSCRACSICRVPGSFLAAESSASRWTSSTWRASARSHGELSMSSPLRKGKGRGLGCLCREPGLRAADCRCGRPEGRGRKGRADIHRRESSTALSEACPPGAALSAVTKRSARRISSSARESSWKSHSAPTWRAPCH